MNSKTCHLALAYILRLCLFDSAGQLKSNAAKRSNEGPLLSPKLINMREKIRETHGADRNEVTGSQKSKNTNTYFICVCMKTPVS